MQWSDNKAIEKWGFWLVLYSFANIFLIAFFMSHPKQFGIHLLAIPLLIPCLLGGIGFLIIGKKLPSAIYMCAGVAVLLPLVVFGPAREEWKIAGICLLGLYVLVTSRRGQLNVNQKDIIEKMAGYFAGFALLVPLITDGIYLYVRSMPVPNRWDFFPTELVWLAAPIVLGGIIYLFLGAIKRSLKYASMGFATLYIAYIYFALTAVLGISFMD